MDTECSVMAVVVKFYPLHVGCVGKTLVYCSESIHCGCPKWEIHGPEDCLDCRLATNLTGHRSSVISATKEFVLNNLSRIIELPMM